MWTWNEIQWMWQNSSPLKILHPDCGSVKFPLLVQIFLTKFKHKEINQEKILMIKNFEIEGQDLEGQ